MQLQSNSQDCCFRMSADFAESVFVPLSNWNTQRGYTRLKNVDTDSYPYRVFGSGDASGLTVILRIFVPDVDYLCFGSVPGFRIKFHNPANDPQVWKKRILLSQDSTKLILINPKVILAEDDIRKYNPDIRNCYYPSEHRLRYFKRYTSRNCETECLANYTLEYCGCVKFSMPSEYSNIANRNGKLTCFALGSNDTKICGSTGLRCILKANSDMFRTRSFEKCKCFRACSSLEYDIEEFQSPDNLAAAFAQSMDSHSYDLEKY